MGTLLQDLSYGWRLLRRAPMFAMIAIGTLALGIGANTALFSVVNGVLLNPLPFPQPQQLVSLYFHTPNFREGSISYLNFQDWQRQSQSFSAMAAFRGDDFNWIGAGQAERLRGEMISAGFFRLLGVNPVLGRTFRAEEDQPGARPVALISAGLWQRRFGTARDVLGRSMNLDGTVYTIIGVVPASFQRSFRFGARDLYIPIGQWNDPTFRDRAVSMGSNCVGRLKPGVSAAQAQAELDAIGRNLAAAYPNADKDSGITLVPLKEDMVGWVRGLLWVLLGAVGFVLLIACANVANLLLARATGRSREFALRAALGAGRGRVVRQLLTESLVLALAGGALGGAVAWWGTRAALAALPKALPRAASLAPDWHALVFTVAVALATAVIFGLAPALKLARGDWQASLKEGGRGGSGTRHRAEGVFVAVEMGLAVVLLIGAGLMLRSLAALWSVNPGFDPHHVLTFEMSTPPGLGENPAAVRARMHEIQQRLEALPGGEAASLAGGSLPLSGNDSELPFWRADKAKPASLQQMPSALFYLVQPDYLAAMRIPLERGRFLTEQDNASSSPVVVIDEFMARKFFPHENPIGQRINLAIINTQPQIVGVTGHVKHWGLDSNGHESVSAQIYMPIAQVPDRFTPLLVRGGMVVVLRARGDPAALAGPVRRTMATLNADEVVYDFATMDEMIADSLSDRRFAMTLLAVFAGLALVLAAIGIYGVVAYLTGQRTHEIGIRMALGAQRDDVVRMVLGEGGRMALAGLGLGLVAAAGLTRLLRSLLFSVSAYDPLTYAAVAIGLGLVAVAACLAPAWRAARVEPNVALRYE